MIELPSSLDVTAELPTALGASPLMQAGGSVVLDDFVNAKRCRALLQEASDCLHQAVKSSVTRIDSEEIRGGNPARRFVSAGGGREQMCLYRCANTIAKVSAWCGSPVRPTGACGTYSYYRPGDFLSLHRDIETCDVSVITCLLDRHGPTSQGGITCLYPKRQTELLSRIRATPTVGAVRQRLKVGSTMVFFGGLIPHSIESLGPKDFRIVSILCFKLGKGGEPLEDGDCQCGCS